MSKNDEQLKKALMKLRQQVLYPHGIQFNDDGTNEPIQPKEIYVPQDKISDADWEKIKKSYRSKFAPLDVPIEIIGRYLDSFWVNWCKGYYPHPNKFIETVDEVFSEFEDALPSKGNKSFTNILYFNELIQNHQTAISEITWDGSKDWERTWDGRIYNDILIEKAQKVEKNIDNYLKKRIKHGLEITDTMKGFKGIEALKKEHQPTPVPATSPEPAPEQSVMVEKIKHLSKEKKKLKTALKHLRHKPTQMEMKEIIDRNRFKSGKCNNEACGRELEVDGETIKAWIKEFGLTRYATNPDHRIK